MSESTAKKSDLLHEVTPSQLLEALEHCLSAQTKGGKSKAQANVMVWGAMGIGKSEICRSIGRLWGMRIVALHLPQFDPTDLKGIPVLMDPNGNAVGEVASDGKVKWIPSSYLPQFSNALLEEDTDTYNFRYDWTNAEQVMVHVYDAGQRLPIADEGMDLISIGSSGSRGKTLITGAVGARSVSLSGRPGNVGRPRSRLQRS